MKKATGIYAFLVENEANVPTAWVKNAGEFKEGPLDDSTLEIAEEGIAGVGIPKIGYSPLVHLDIPGSLADTELKMFRKLAKDVAKQSGRKVELVRFGENGRESVDWFLP